MKRILTTVCAMSLAGSVWAVDWQALPSKAPEPENNMATEAKIALGKQLYFDPRLSSTGKISCNTCHDVNKGGVDNLAFSEGVDGLLGGRNAPTVWNSAFHEVQFWDGRAASLEVQSIGPMVNPVEMGMKNHDVVMSVIADIPGYVSQFDEVFGKNAVTIDNTAKAIAAYERTLITPNSPFDAFVREEAHPQAMTQYQKKGMDLFAQIGCVSCHSGAAFNGPSVPGGFYVPFPTFESSPYVAKYDLKADKGRGGVTGVAADEYKWRIPTLRNVQLTAPYFHNGSVDTLNEAIRVMASTQLNRTLNDKEVLMIEAFLNSLTGSVPYQEAPILPASKVLP